ncbi:MAG: glutamine-hydrolyzing carbamoyl-phosphate synthase small subunit [Gammaproteobacteria bacterium]|nr:glutamine-hydrolyzing carbamoyl-phosphate synthase small subunit [Gammaproteobacteria bacterium]
MTTVNHSRERAPAGPALLVLEDGTLFRGRSVGAPGMQSGEVVFNTALTGYQEILTDPSYARQLVTLTYPHIGNVGATAEDCESRGVFCAGLIVKDVPRAHSNWRAQTDLPGYLRANDVVAISGIDTRKLTRLIRDKGAQRGCIAASDNADDAPDVERALAAAKQFPGLAGLDLAQVVTTGEAYRWREGVWRLDRGYGAPPPSKFKVVACDFGVKHNILRLLAERGCDITVLPAQTGAEEILARQPHGVFLSNGPGDPEPCHYAVAAIGEIVERGIPTFGICLGHQLLALASGAQTEKMKFGHHGANHPVRELDTGRVLITSQNHGFAVRESPLPARLRITHRSLFDGSVQGLERTDKPAFSFQGHPEASPGPRDIRGLFDRFVALMQSRAGDSSSAGA